MTIKRLIATADNTISNAFKSNLTERGTKANMGESDILEVFSIYAQVSTSSIEKARILLQFPIDKIQKMRAESEIPAAGSVKFYLNLYNAPHGQTSPEKYSLSVSPVSRPWEEGYGLDMESYLNEGPSNWLSASVLENWSSPGGDYISSAYISGTLPIPEAHYVTGTADDVKVDITSVVEEWLKVEASTATKADTEFNFLLPINADSKIKIYSADSTQKTYKFVSSGALTNKNINVNSSKEIEVRLGDNSVLFSSSTPADYVGLIVTIADGSKTVNFTGADLGAGADPQETSATEYRWNTNGATSPSLAAAAFRAAVALSITNSKLEVQAPAIAAESPALVLVTQASGKSASISTTSNWSGKGTLTTGKSATIEHLKEALTSSLGHNGQITVKRASGSSILQLTQSMSGISGNTYLSKSIESLPNNMLTFGADPQLYGTSTQLSQRAFTGGTGLNNAGLGVFMSGAYEDGSRLRSYYTKKFFARGSEFVLRRPNIEVQWDSKSADDRGYLVTTSPHRADANNKQTIYFYNWIAGALVDLPSPPKFTLTTDKTLAQKATFAPGGDAAVEITSTKVAGTTGTYKAEFEISPAITTTTLYEKWWIGAENDANLLKGHDGNSPVEVRQWYVDSNNVSAHVEDNLLVKMTNLKNSYEPSENARFRMFVRNKNISQNIYTVASTDLPSYPLKNAFFKIKRIPDDFVVIPYSTGSINYSGLSYDKEGNYFDLDMSLLEPGYAYEISILTVSNNTKIELSDKFKFRVD